jgi:hypothetical protein
MSCWLGVVSREHVARGVERGIAQIGHGKRASLARMQPGDWLVYYSPRERLRDGAPVKAFTAVGRLVDDVVWQADEGAFKPWRRRVDYLEAREAPVRLLLDVLDLTRSPNWGYALRRGLLELTRHDFTLIYAAMTEQ